MFGAGDSFSALDDAENCSSYFLISRGARAGEGGTQMDSVQVVGHSYKAHIIPAAAVAS
jgi:hypothetical protein